MDSETWEITDDKVLIANKKTMRLLDDVETVSQCKEVFKPDFQRNSDISGTWKFDDKKEKLIVTTQCEEITYEILELKEKKLKLKFTESGKSKRFTFETLD